MRFVYVIEKPGSDLDGEDTIIRAETREEADVLAEVRCKAWGCTSLRYIGRREGQKYIFDIPPSELPGWAREETPCACGNGSCMLCDDNGMVARAREVA